MVAEFAPIAVVVAVGLAWALGKRSREVEEEQRPVSQDFGTFPVVLLFTSNSCDNCPPARDVVFAEAGNLAKEIHYDLEPGLFERVRLNGVPTTLVVGSNGLVIQRFEGIPEAGSVAAALKSLG